MKLSQTRNMTSDTGVPYSLVEVGVILFFRGDVQKYFEVTSIDNRGRPFSGEVDLFELERKTKIQSIVFEK